jgi:hypothetical protein
MKIRSGFVSNSSSSSFVVARYENPFAQKRPKKALTLKKERVLIKAGFIKSVAYYPHQVDLQATPEEIDKDLDSFANWVRSVTCNQDDEIALLLKNRISFVADVHYEHYTMIYDGKSDKLLIAQNYGKQAQMGGTEKIDFKPWREPGLKKTTGKEYLKNTQNYAYES